ncbi:MAG: MBL fold metallo-hydrolase [Lachnospiraceae bacterium]|nr:MBL fold metallo-hydrolase [Lachnospiraceae bacterium]
MKRNGKIMGVIIGLFLAAGFLLSGLAKTEAGTNPPLKATLFKVGKADATVIQTDGHTMVIDAGEEEDGEEIVDFLRNQGISRVDVLVITHFDRDHVGGADTLVESMEIGEVHLPAYQGGNTEYTDFMRALENKGIKPKLLTQPVELMLGTAKVVTEPPLSYENDGGVAEIDNNFSLITTIMHGENVLLFTGDAEKQRTREWLSGKDKQDCDFLKMPHHGVYHTALKELLEAVMPEYAVICSSGKNPADPETLELLKNYGISTFQTKDGNVTVISDGKNLEVHQALEY